jgi:hypothetical protein
MKKLFPALALAAVAASAVSAQPPTLEQELRAEIARLKEQVVRAEALLQRIQGSAPAPVVAAAPAPAAAPAAPKPPAKPPGLNTPSKLPASDAKNFLKTPPWLDVLLQAGYYHFEDPAQNSTFLLRKAEIGFKGHVSPYFDYCVELDFARAPNFDPYRRTYLRMSHWEHLHVKVGLEKAPISVDELSSSGQVAFVQRSEVADRYSLAEEMGVFFESNWPQWLLQASVTNGGRRLYRDDNKRKDFTGRAVWAPLPNLTLGVATVQGAIGPTSQDRIRYQAEMRYGYNQSQGAMAEYYRAKDGPVWSDGFYVAGYWAFPVKNSWMTHFQPVARYESIERDDNDRSRELELGTLGFSLFFADYKSKFQVNWLHDLRSQRLRKDEIRTLFTVEF